MPAKVSKQMTSALKQICDEHLVDGVYYIEVEITAHCMVEPIRDEDGYKTSFRKSIPKSHIYTIGFDKDGNMECIKINGDSNPPKLDTDDD